MTDANCSWHCPATCRGNFLPEACNPEETCHRAQAKQAWCRTPMADALLHVPGFQLSLEAIDERSVKLDQRKAPCKELASPSQTLM